MDDNELFSHLSVYALLQLATGEGLVLKNPGRDPIASSIEALFGLQQGVSLFVVCQQFGLDRQMYSATHLKTNQNSFPQRSVISCHRAEKVSGSFLIPPPAEARGFLRTQRNISNQRTHMVKDASAFQKEADVKRTSTIAPSHG